MSALIRNNVIRKIKYCRTSRRKRTSSPGFPRIPCSLVYSHGAFPLPPCSQKLELGSLLPQLQVSLFLLGERRRFPRVIRGQLRVDRQAASGERDRDRHQGSHGRHVHHEEDRLFAAVCCRVAEAKSNDNVNRTTRTRID